MAFEMINSFVDSVFTSASSSFLDFDQALTPTAGNDFGWQIGGSAANLNYIMSRQLTKSGTLMNGEAMLRIAAVFDSVRMISQDIAKLPLDLKEPMPGGGARTINKMHSLYFRISVSPDKQIRSQTFWETMIAHSLIWGNGYALIKRDESESIVTSLEQLHPSNVTVQRSNGMIWYQVNLVDEKNNRTGETKAIMNMDMFHLHGIGDGITSWPIANFALESMGLTLSTETLQSAFMGNGGHLSGVLQTPEKITDPEIKKQMVENFGGGAGGPNNAGNIAFLSHGTIFVPIDMKFTDAQLLETRRFQIEETARWFNIPLHKLAILSSNATFNNIAEENLSYIDDTLNPWIRRIEGEISFKLLPENSLFFARFNTRELTRGDTKTTVAVMKDLFAMAAATPNQILESIGENPYPGGDVHYIPANITTVEEVQAHIPNETDAANTNGVTQETLQFEKLKSKYDAYGVGVRAGALTPQTIDEDSFRAESGLPKMGDAAKQAWVDDGGVRRPITLQSQGAFEATQELAESPSGSSHEEEDENQAQQSLSNMLDYRQVIVDSLQPIIQREVKFKENSKKTNENFYERQAQLLLEKIEVHISYLQMELPRDFIEKWTENRDILNWQEQKAGAMADDLILHYYNAQNEPDGVYTIRGKRVKKEGLTLSYA